ncbi:glycosyl hydrolase family 8 [Brevibacillus laterosporus]|uniref:glycosyl hydrolase family 8 n=1 Tax=Brevibacillus laterosporus TaxID=1465 RepID=UPI000839C4C8|nr:glycosyl hydrolase family 8 [Brevibacillus laterosporus]
MYRRYIGPYYINPYWFYHCPYATYIYPYIARQQYPIPPWYPVTLPLSDRLPLTAPNFIADNTPTLDDAEMRYLSLNTCSDRSFKPFPQHTSYTVGTIQPNINQEKLDQDVRDFYEKWKDKYLIKYKEDQYYVNVKGEVDPEQAVSTSETHGYGMMLSVIMAGYNPDSKVHFDGLYRFYKAFPSINNPVLMAYKQIQDDNGDIKNYDTADDKPDSATDGDMDIAYSLLLAHYQWGSNGTFNYLNEAKKMINMIMCSDVNPWEWFLKLGDWAPNDTTKEFGKGVRPSDFIIDHLKAFQKVTMDPRWFKVINKTYTIMNELYNPNTGLLPDFAKKQNGKFQPVTGKYLEDFTDGNYYTNACRTPWRLSMDYLLTGDTRALPLLTQLNTWIIAKTGGEPNQIRSGYDLNGNALSSSETKLEFVSPFAVSAMIDASNQEWLTNLWTYMNSYNPDKSNCFGNTLKLLCMVVISHNWWFPISTNNTISHSNHFYNKIDHQYD